MCLLGFIHLGVDGVHDLAQALVDVVLLLSEAGQVLAQVGPQTLLIPGTQHTLRISVFISVKPVHNNSKQHTVIHVHIQIDNRSRKMFCIEIQNQ